MDFMFIKYKELETPQACLTLSLNFLGRFVEKIWTNQKIS